jgi:DNA-binding NtrC family response regulator
MMSKNKAMIKIFNMNQEGCGNDNQCLDSRGKRQGKELVARAIHEQSPRKNMPFVVIKLWRRTGGTSWNRSFLVI